MIDAEMFKILIQGGSFALVVFGFVWTLVKVVPRLEARQDAKDNAFLAALDKQHVEHKEELAEDRVFWNQRLDRLHDKIDLIPGRAPTDRNSRGGA